MRRPQTPVGLALATLLLASSPASAQTLFGHVLDSLSGRPLPSAAVVLLDSVGKNVRYTLSDSMGRFELKAPRAGSTRCTWTSSGTARS
jgi:hypothetical protein